MKVYPIDHPAAGERVIAVDPDMKPGAEAGWRRRLNLYTGRSLGDAALETEQIGRAGRLTHHGQMISPGVVSGLELAREPAPPGESDAHLLHVGSGFGIAASGESVTLPGPLTVDVRSLDLALPAPGPLPWSYSWTTPDALVGDGTPPPRAAILTLQPVAVGDAGAFNPGDPCERDRENDAFDDLQYVDGCRLILHALPDEWTPGALDESWRNLLVYRIFEFERTNGSGMNPWEAFGVPVGLIALDEHAAVLLVDRFSVVRAGGKPAPRTASSPNAGSPFLWQARMLQFLEQTAQTPMDESGGEPAARWFRYLPPAGLLPRHVARLPSGLCDFFPSRWSVQARPAPLEQLDVALEAGASLKHFDLWSGDRVEVLVPVPGVLYDPALLMHEEPDPEFKKTIEEFLTRLGKALKRREDVREKRDAIAIALSGAPPEYPDPDPLALDGEWIFDAPPDPAEKDYGTTKVGDDRMATAFQNLFARLKTLPWIKGELEALNVSNPDAFTGLESFILSLEEKVKRADDTIDMGFLRVQVDIHRIRQHMLGSSAASRLNTSPALAAIAKGQSALTVSAELGNYFKALKENGQATIKVDGPPTVGGELSPEKVDVATTAAGELSLERVDRATTSGGDLGAGRVTGGALATTGSRSAAVLGADPYGSDESRLMAEAADATDPYKTAEPGAAAPGEVTLKRPIVGKACDFRTVTVADRLEEPVAAEAKNFSVAAKYETIRRMSELEINVDDIEAPGFHGYDENGELIYEDVPITTNDIRKTRRTAKEIRWKFGDIKEKGLAWEVLEDRHDPDPANADESAFFSSAIRAVDNSAAILRLVEGRIQAYKNAIRDCKKTAVELGALEGEAESRLRAIDVELAEARHDVAAARALLAEEVERVNGINERRAAILDKHVPFLAFRRPLNVDNLADAPIRGIDPGPAESPVPACLTSDVAPPDALRAMVALLREAPLKWFASVPGVLSNLDRLDLLNNAIVNARSRAVAMAEGSPEPFAVGAGVMGQSIRNVITARREVVRQSRVALARYDTTRLSGQSWRQCRETAAALLSIGDLLQAGHGRSDVSRQVSREIDDMARIAACLYIRFSETTPVIRLEWAERLGQYDLPVNLRNLTSLPRWAEIDIRDRREMQALSDWLYQRMNPEIPEAVHMIHDLVRVCILLASHAPVKRIIAGHIAEETAAVSEGSRVALEADVAQLTIGMSVAVYKGEKLAARAVVEDLTSDRAVARVLKVMEQETATLDKATTSIRFGVGV